MHASLASVTPLASAVVEDLFRRSNAAKWGVTREQFTQVLDTSVRHGFRDASPGRREVDRYLNGLHVADLALATACALGSDVAWDHFVLTHRPVLYRAADALSPGGSAREIADSLYADLYGLREGSSERQSLFRYFHGRSSLATWLRSVLAQRFVDSLRAQRRTEPLEEDGERPTTAAAAEVDPDRSALVPLVENAIRTAIDGLPPKDRLRLRSYYVSGLTLAEIGRITAEHEATVSRQLTRTRRALREAIEGHLRDERHLSPAQIARALELAIGDPGSLDLQQVFAGDDHERKKSRRNRST